MSATPVNDVLRGLPSVDQVTRELQDLCELPAELIVREVREAIAMRRAALLAGGPVPASDLTATVRARLHALLNPSLRRVVNATGIILHTNLGRAPLTQFSPVPRYSNLEYELQTGRRGKRDAHTAGLLQALLSRPAVVVNNNAAAVFLILHELAAGAEVIVSRGELIEIGDGFRIPEIMARSGAILREVGTTNRTSLADYRNAINERTRLILRVHPSNFQISGFTARPELQELCGLGRAANMPVYEDLGSGCLIDLKAAGVNEPLVDDSLSAGVNIVSFSCDKLLGGPQSGIITGDSDLVARVRRNPMYRALRVDKLIVEALETTLRELLKRNWNALPALQMIFAPLASLEARARRVAHALQTSGMQVEIAEGAAPIGGGSTPDQVLPTWEVLIDIPHVNDFEARLRMATVPIIARIEKQRVVLDMRTVADEEEAALVEGVCDAWQQA